MATGSSPEAARARIISHMNADHQDSLILYLEHYHGLSSFASRNAQLVDISLNHMLISTNATKKPVKGTTQTNGSCSYTIVFDPPLKAWSETRERVAAMDKQCRRALGRKEMTLKVYFAPRGFSGVVMLVCALTYLTFYRRANLSPTTAPEFLRPILKKFPGVAEFLWKVQPMVFVPMVLVHLSEATYMHLTRLRPLNVSTGSNLWLKWMASTFVEGFGNFMRIDAWVKDEEERRAKSKH